MLHLSTLDLRHDPAAASFVKDEIVQVQFARTDGELISLEGLNSYRAGDALISATTGERWCVSRNRFDSKYEPVSQDCLQADGAYRNKPVAVLAKQMQVPFSIARSSGGDVLQGSAGDWLMQYGPGDFGITANARFQRVYRRTSESR